MHRALGSLTLWLACRLGLASAPGGPAVTACNTLNASSPEEERSPFPSPPSRDEELFPNVHGTLAMLSPLERSAMAGLPHAYAALFALRQKCPGEAFAAPVLALVALLEMKVADAEIVAMHRELAANPSMAAARRLAIRADNVASPPAFHHRPAESSHVAAAVEEFFAARPLLTAADIPADPLRLLVPWLSSPALLEVATAYITGLRTLMMQAEDDPTPRWMPDPAMAVVLIDRLGAATTAQRSLVFADADVPTVLETLLRAFPALQYTYLVLKYPNAYANGPLLSELSPIDPHVLAALSLDALVESFLNPFVAEKIQDLVNAELATRAEASRQISWGTLHLVDQQPHERSAKIAELVTRNMENAEAFYAATASSIQRSRWINYSTLEPLNLQRSHVTPAAALAFFAAQPALDDKQKTLVALILRVAYAPKVLRDAHSAAKLSRNADMLRLLNQSPFFAALLPFK